VVQAFRIGRGGVVVDALQAQGARMGRRWQHAACAAAVLRQKKKEWGGDHGETGG
jgi:hypothetical protein